MSGGCLRFVLGDQLSHDLSSLADLDPACDTVLMVEVQGETTYVRHHRKKLVLILSAMRHFAAELAQRGVAVDYVRLDDPANSGSFRGELVRAVARHQPDRVVVTHPGEYRVLRDMADWQAACGVPVEMREDTRFFGTRAGFARWARGRRTLRWEDFYRQSRVAEGLLLTADGAPEGGRWCLEPPPARPHADAPAVPPPYRMEPDATTHAVIDLVAERFPDHFGDLEPFWFPVTAAEAERAFDQFRVQTLPHFGDHPDVMKTGEPVLFHAVLSFALNLGLMDPRRVCRTVEADWRAGRIPLVAAEAFIRRVLGWREFIRGVYWLKMPEYADLNHLGAYGPLPRFFWTGDTPMACLRECLAQTRREAYCHQSQRLMVTGNFALLAGLSPRDVSEWYLSVYADGIEWAHLPNLLGQCLHADGGLLGGKPAAASGKAISRLSDYCTHCPFDVEATVGPRACPFNFLYWHFLAANRPRLLANARLRTAYGALDKLPPDQREAIRRQAESFLNSLL